MNLLYFKKEKECVKRNPKSIYIINQEIYKINDKEFKIKNSTANISNYLKTINTSLNELIKYSINGKNKCKYCGNETKFIFGRKRLIIYHFCSIKCQQKYKQENKILKCNICNKEFNKKYKEYGTCGNKECVKKSWERKSQNIKKNHWVYKSNKNEIIKQRVITRKENDIKFKRKYKAWNKGKKGIYSKETIEKIRKATLRQLENQKIKKTKIEEKIEEYLKKQNINYTYSIILYERQFDFLLKDYNIIIEADGDYWHGNPEKFPVLTNKQLLKRKDDEIKNNIVINGGYTIIRFWEHDIHNNFNEVKKEINKEICKKRIQK